MWDGTDFAHGALLQNGLKQNGGSQVLAEFFLLFKLWTHIATFLGPCLASGCIWGTPNTRLWVPEPVLKAGSRKTKFLVVRLVYQKQIVQERRDFREGISSRSRHGSSRYADFWYREVWLTVRILCTVLNSKMALYTTGACKCLAEFFLLFKLGPILQHSWVPCLASGCICFG